MNDKTLNELKEILLDMSDFIYNLCGHIDEMDISTRLKLIDIDNRIKKLSK